MDLKADILKIPGNKFIAKGYSSDIPKLTNVSNAKYFLCILIYSTKT